MRGCKTSGGAVNMSGITQQASYTKLLQGLGGGYAPALGINLASMESDEVFKWFWLRCSLVPESARASL